MKLLKPIHPNVGLEAWLRRELQALVDEMHVSVNYWLIAAYKNNLPRVLANDESPAATQKRRVRKLRKRWTTKFSDKSQGLAVTFSGDTLNRVNRVLGSQMAVQFKMTSTMRDVMEATVGEQVGLIKSISSDYFDEIEGLVMRSVANGRDLKYLTDELQKRYKVTRKRAAFIARDQNNKATAQIVATRQLELGLTQAVWIHSGGGKEPRQSHVKAGRDKLVFDIKQGAFIDNEYIKPGEKINCRCVSRAIIPD